MTGTLYGLGVGPGDPELMTLKAVRIMGEVPVIAYLAPEGGESLARAIAAAHLPGGQVEIAISMPMRASEKPGRDAYDRCVPEIIENLNSGKDVAFLCEGDPMLYGSFMYVMERVIEDFPIEIVPGVSSLGAVAAAAQMPLASRNEIFTLIPATLDAETLETRLRDADGAAVFKVGRHLDKVRQVLDRLGRLEGAMVVERASQPDQRVIPLADIDPTDSTAPYFSMILVGRT